MTFWSLRDRKSTRLNSSHTVISYAVFCLKKKKRTTTIARSATKPPTARRSYILIYKPTYTGQAHQEIWRARRPTSYFFFFFNDTATTEIYTLPLHDALPISPRPFVDAASLAAPGDPSSGHRNLSGRDRKSTRLNSSHTVISYAVFCLKK